MNTNTKAILRKPGSMVIVETAMPSPKDDEVLIKIDSVGICGSDIHAFKSGPYIPPKDPNQEIGLGHECAGTVVAIGKGVTGLVVGDTVCVEPGVPCRTCNYCLEGKYNICPDVDFMATQPNYRGALTNYLSHPARFTYKLPDTMSLVEGALVEPAAVGMHAASLAKVKPGQKIVILGAGCIGLMTLQACKTMGATEIVVVDVIEKRLDMAKKLGAMEVIDASAQNSVDGCRSILGAAGADIVFETAGSQVTAKQAVLMVARGGKIMIVGTIPGETPIDFLKINREVSIQTVFRYRNCYPQTIQAIASGQFDVASMVTNTYEYKDVQIAFEDSVSKSRDIIKSVVKMPTE